MLIGLYHQPDQGFPPNCPKIFNFPLLPPSGLYPTILPLPKHLSPYKLLIKKKEKLNLNRL